MTHSPSAGPDAGYRADIDGLRASCSKWGIRLFDVNDEGAGQGFEHRIEVVNVKCRDEVQIVVALQPAQHLGRQT